MPLYGRSSGSPSPVHADRIVSLALGIGADALGELYWLGARLRMCKVHDGEPQLARLSRLRKGQIKGLLVPPPAHVPASSTGEAVCHAHASSGIVSKCLGSPYRSGRSRHWVKSKNPAAPTVKREAKKDWASSAIGMSGTFRIGAEPKEIVPYPYNL